MFFVAGLAQISATWETTKFLSLGFNQMGGGKLDEIILFGVIPAPLLPMEKLLPEMYRILRPGGTMAVWPPSWIHQSILRSGLFKYSIQQNHVMNYRRVDK